MTSSDELKADLKNVREIREMEHRDFVATDQDYDESIYAVKGAIKVLKAKTADTKQADIGESLMQVSALSRVSEEARQVQKT